jgi:hypothetical protein
MDIREKYKLNSAEYSVWQIYEAYTYQLKKRGDFKKYLPTKSDPRESKNWKYFELVHKNFDKDTMFDPYIFMEAQFRNVPKDKTLFPGQLKTKTAVSKYSDHKDSLRAQEPVSSSEKIMTNLANTFIFLKKWWARNNLPINSYKEFFEIKSGEMLSEGMLFCIQGMISKYFMATSKHFIEEYNKLDLDMKYEIIQPKELKSYKIKLLLDQEAYSFAKEFFKNEII